MPSRLTQARAYHPRARTLREETDRSERTGAERAADRSERRGAERAADRSERRGGERAADRSAGAVRALRGRTGAFRTVAAAPPSGRARPGAPALRRVTVVRPS